MKKAWDQIYLMLLAGILTVGGAGLWYEGQESYRQCEILHEGQPK